MPAIKLVVRSYRNVTLIDEGLADSSFGLNALKQVERKLSQEK